MSGQRVGPDFRYPGVVGTKSRSGTFLGVLSLCRSCEVKGVRTVPRWDSLSLPLSRRSKRSWTYRPGSDGKENSVRFRRDGSDSVSDRPLVLDAPGGPSTVPPTWGGVGGLLCTRVRVRTTGVGVSTGTQRSDYKHRTVPSRGDSRRFGTSLLSQPSEPCRFLQSWVLCPLRKVSEVEVSQFEGHLRRRVLHPYRTLLFHQFGPARL